ncbi:hypothetical protein F0562_026532 [Nyssa sinensis]|uniref:CHORD domain-containing protein n=1 Tax=Nyssa sinensis TaxID=561372 RepID=A0A5J5BBQ0_9ASTE|nr:hypothetical protein F0562_026532 [Nyssa sinensis]
MANVAKLRCQRIGCDAMFTEDDNPEGSCRYHDAPLFHDGMKEWSCCKKRSHDFSLFLEIPGCKTGKHTTEKPVTKAVTTSKKPIPTRGPATDALSKEACARCRQGFFCSEHGTQAREMNPKPSNTVAVTPAESNTDVQEALSAPTKKIVDINEPQICRNKGCGKTFREKDNHDTACNYHPGPAVFHDRMRGVRYISINVCSLFIDSQISNARFLFILYFAVEML